MALKCIAFLLSAIITIPLFGQSGGESTRRSYWKSFSLYPGARQVMPREENCGIYRTSHDLRSGKLSLSIDCKSEDHRIKPAFIGDKSAIKVVREMGTDKFLRRDIYGYRDCKGNEYHFFEGESYELLNPGESIPIYRTFEQKGKQKVTRFFFSVVSSATPQPLSLENLSIEFSNESLFLENLRVLARNDHLLRRYLHAINRLRMNASQAVNAM